MLKTLDPRLTIAEDQPRRSQPRAAGAVGPGLGEAQVDALVAGKIGVRDHVRKAALPFDMRPAARRRPACLRRSSTSISHNLPGFSVTSAILVMRTPDPGRKSIAHGESKLRDLGDRERRIRRRRRVAIGAAPQAASTADSGSLY